MIGLGAEVLTVEADAGDLEQMRRAVELAEERFGRIDGVLHAAGVTGGESFVPLSDTRPCHAEEHFRPKAWGVLVLERLFRGREPDFFLLFSSLSTVLGGVGFAAYAAANQLMDAFAHERSRAGAVPWMSVCWDGWRFADAEPARSRGEEVRRLAMTADEGVEVLRRLVAAGAGGRMVVSTGDLRLRAERRPAAAEASPDLARAARPPSSAACGNDVERRIAEVFGEVLGIARVGAHDDFFELGGDSLLATQVLAGLRRKGLEVSLSRLFAATTVADLARALEAREPA